jgi:hypothetical protein
MILNLFISNKLNIVYLFMKIKLIKYLDTIIPNPLSYPKINLDKLK